jgi:hypothetical protein
VLRDDRGRAVIHTAVIHTRRTGSANFRGVLWDGRKIPGLKPRPLLPFFRRVETRRFYRRPALQDLMLAGCRTSGVKAHLILGLLRQRAQGVPHQRLCVAVVLRG